MNLSKNCISRIENLSNLKKLTTLSLGHNHITTVDDFVHLKECPQITTLDLQENRIQDGMALLEVLEHLPDLSVLYLQGNPGVKKIRHYRRQVIARLKNLKYLDDRPVFDDERQRCEVFWRVYQENNDERAAAHAEREEIARQGKEKREKEEREFIAFAEFVRKSAEEYAAKNQLELESSSDELSDDVEMDMDDKEQVNGTTSNENTDDLPPLEAIDGAEVSNAVGTVDRENANQVADMSPTSAGNIRVPTLKTSDVNQFSGEPILQRKESARSKEIRAARWASILRVTDANRKKVKEHGLDEASAAAEALAATEQGEGVVESSSNSVVSEEIFSASITGSYVDDSLPNNPEELESLNSDISRRGSQFEPDVVFMSVGQSEQEETMDTNPVEEPDEAKTAVVKESILFEERMKVARENAERETQRLKEEQSLSSTQSVDVLASLIDRVKLEDKQEEPIAQPEPASHGPMNATSFKTTSSTTNVDDLD